MKKLVALLFILMGGFFFISNAYAGSTTLKITCPSKVDINESFTCTVYATAKGKKINNLTYEIDPVGPVSKLKENIKTEDIDVDTTTKIGTVSFKAKSSSGDVTIKISVNAKDANNRPISFLPAFDYITVQSNINTLSSIKIDGSTISGFSKNKTSYTFSTTKSSISLTATRTSSKSTLTGTGTKNLSCGSNVYTLKVTAENKDTKNYTVGIKRVCDSNVYLDGINVSEGSLSPEFNKNTTNYEVKVDKNTSKISVTGIKSTNNQTITGNVTDKKLNYGSNKINITVTSETGSKQTYTVNVIREDNRNASTYLSSLSLSSGIIDFDKNTFEYETKVLYEIENIEVLAVPEDESSKVTIKGNENLKVGDNYITVTVTAENKEKKSYVIKVTRLNEGETLGDNANIKNITIKGYDLQFDPEKTDYKLVIKNEDQLSINVEMEDENATYEIEGNENLKDGSIITIKTTSPDQTNKEYTINITKSDYTVYFIIAGVLVALAIAIPVIVYFKSVRPKKEHVDVNGYKIDKEYEDNTASRHVISQNAPNTIPNSSEKGSKKFSLGSLIKPNHSKVTENSQMSAPKTNSNQQLDRSGFDTELQNYNPSGDNNLSDKNINNTNVNTSNMQNQNNQNINFAEPINPNQTSIQSTTQCPNCGRELLKEPEICPYCNFKLK